MGEGCLEGALTRLSPSCAQTRGKLAVMVGVGPGLTPTPALTLVLRRQEVEKLGALPSAFL